MNNLLKIYIYGFICGFGLCAGWLHFYPPQLELAHTLWVEEADFERAQDWCLKQGWCMDIEVFDE